MKKHYNRTANGFFAKVKALLMLLCVSGIAQAQLSGNYTIDATKNQWGKWGSQSNCYVGRNDRFYHSI
ncbi:MAG: hypothetical protein EBT66_08905 [Bacteroidetes bacterium]|nr:hypothetical protein [Bacteroidota bacterium]